MEQARSMRDNVKFCNIPEKRGNQENCQDTIKAFMKDEMKITAGDMEKIKFERIHRVGRRFQNHNRPMIGKVNPEGKAIIFKHTKNLNRAKNYRVQDQLPRELEERKKRLVQNYKEAKQEHKEVKWQADKLVINGKVKAIEKDRVKDININTTEVAAGMDVRHTPPMTHNSSSFQGHSTAIQSQDDIVPALHAIYADSRVARANHNMYAYRIQTGSTVIEHYEDDREWGAGRQLLKLLKDHNITNKIVCVSRWNGASNLGRARFDHILKAAKLTLQIEE